MVSARRLGLPMALVALAFALLVLRLFQVQVLEHRVWAREAANLRRSWTIEPYRRGRILDREGRLFASDQEYYELRFVWRDFRRGHPLGLVAQMRSLLLLEPVSLSRALDQLEPWARELVRLSPAEIDAFGRGAPLSLSTLEVPAAADASEEQRWARAADLHFYVKALLGLSWREARAITRLRGEPDWQLSHLALAAKVGGGTAEQVEERLAARLVASTAELGRLAAALDLEGLDAPEGLGLGGPGLAGNALARLVAVIEEARRDVEDAAADDLFRAAVGFSPARLDAQNLAALELDWLARCVFWDRGRLEEWIARRGAAWDEAAGRELAGRAIARSKVGRESAAHRVVAGLANHFRPPARRGSAFGGLAEDWRSIEELVVLSELSTLFEDVELSGASARRAVLPFQDHRLRAPGLDDATLLEGLLADRGEARELAERLLAIAEATGRPTWDPDEEALVAGILREWNARLQDAVAELLDAARAELARPGEPPPRLRLSAWRRKVAREERDYVVRDRGARPLRLSSDPRYDLVQLVARYPERYAGFVIRTTGRRVRHSLDEEAEPLPLAEALIGAVRQPFLVDLLGQVREGELVRGLQTQLERSEEELERLAEVVGGIAHSGESRGGTGIEGYFDALLRGRNGYRETHGLEEHREASAGVFYRAPVHGRDLRLTIDVELQRAAQRILEHPPRAPAGDPRPDDVWSEHPVGAIVLITPGGEVLAAASVPTRPGEPGFAQDGERARVIDRTLRRPRFQPPGSVLKPMVAAWALQYQGLDPQAGLVACVPAGPTEAPHWGGVHCHSRWGHSVSPADAIGLARALERSCNVYFAHLGERWFDGEALRAMARAFGFGRPTGVRSLAPGLAGLGLVEDHGAGRAIDRDGAPMLARDRRWIANGLTGIEATPMQVARAFAGLATGVLPELRLVLGHEPLQLAPRPEPLPIEERHLARVREALEGVVAQPGGSAYGKGLDEASLGFRLAAKTGSADYDRHGRVPDYPLSARSGFEWVSGVRKHAWVAGWFPAEDPRAIVVVYVHDTATTSSHGAVYVAAALLSTPELRGWLAGQGVALTGGEADR